MWFNTQITNALEKIRCGKNKDWNELKQLSALKGERVSFQIAMQAEFPVFVSIAPTENSAFIENVKIRQVEDVPCYHPSDNKDKDTWVITREPGLLPDPLFELTPMTRISCGNWHSFWVDVTIPEDTTVGKHTLKLTVKTRGDNEAQSVTKLLTMPLTIVNGEMPQKSDLKFTNWFYCDCIEKQHDVELWSEKCWEILSSYFSNMVDHGGNMLLTPLWTLSLGIEIGKHRPTCQLLIVKDKGNEKYCFDFSRLERWIDTASAAGIEIFEMSHAYSQWGATASAHVVLENSDGEEEARFGWHVSAMSKSYKNFLSQLMPQLLHFLRKKGLQKHCYFHVSDEPITKYIDTYTQASQFFTPLTEEFPVIDALSHVEFYQKGLVAEPIPDIQNLETFLKENIAKRWTYYCHSYGNTPARYIGTPSLRNRITGLILYFYDVNAGFLHWGYNGWYTRQSWTFDIDPYKETDWGRYARSGAGFLVYPGDDVPRDSLRHEVFYHAIEDYRVLRALEVKIGRDKVLSLIRKSLDYDFSMDSYPRNNEWFLNLRDRINHEFNKA
jgi:Glycoside hydrolase 123, catalytic domain